MDDGAAAARPGHAVFKARIGARIVVVKQYRIDMHGAAKNIKSFFNEVSILCKLKSPFIVKVEQMFMDRKHVFVQMPHYSLGNLLQWATDMAPPTEVARRCLHQVAIGLHHLHQLQIVHCDIKPENIFIDADGRPRIGDFDVSVDNSTRTTVSHTKSTTAVGAAGTLGYMAPEVLNLSNGCSNKTDVFSYGATLEMVMVTTLQASDDELMALVAALMAKNPDVRPTTAAIVDHEYFSADLHWRQKELRECVVCFEEDVPVEDGLECGASTFVVVVIIGCDRPDYNSKHRLKMNGGLTSFTCSHSGQRGRRAGAPAALAAIPSVTDAAEFLRGTTWEWMQNGHDVNATIELMPNNTLQSPWHPDCNNPWLVEVESPHFTCSDCVTQMTDSYAGDDVATLNRRQSKIPCPGDTHDHPVYFDDGEIARRVPVEVFNKHIDARKKVLEEKIARVLEADMQQRVNIELAKLQSMDEVGRKVRSEVTKIREHVLTLKCPRDGQAFLDFTGCLALPCSRCPCRFCGWCLEDCGDDAHPHIRECTVKPAAAQNDPYFAPMNVFDEHWRQRRRDQVQRCLEALDDEVREGVERELRQDLLDLGM